MCALTGTSHARIGSDAKHLTGMGGERVGMAESVTGAFDRLDGPRGDVFVGAS